jgi:predicted nucleic acid-binding protein
MLTFVLDASAILRFVDNEAGADRVRTILLEGANGNSAVEISPVNWGEVIYILAKRANANAAIKLAYNIFERGAASPVAAAQRAERTGVLKLKYNIGYSDAFALELAQDSKDHVLVTADFDFKPAANDVAIEFLPTKP